MVYLPPPHLASETRPSYGEAYAKILATHRRSPATSASSVIILVSPDVDALCAAHTGEIRRGAGAAGRRGGRGTPPPARSAQAAAGADDAAVVRDVDRVEHR